MKAIVFVLLFLTISCTVKPEKIVYGKDACHYCKMNIVDKTHASQLVTKKGKQYKYDAIECLLNDLKTIDKGTLEFFLVTDYRTPEKLIDARMATFLISDGVKSPMGENLAGFESKEAAKSMAEENNNGTIYTWQDIQELFQTK